jgi:pilus assembly protein CpaF
MIDELIGFGPISPLLRSKMISEVMVNGPNHVFIESKGKLYETGVRFFNAQHLIAIIQRIVEPLGRHVDAASPMVDARLPDGSRVNAIIPPLALDGSSVTIRKFADKKLTTDDLIAFGSMTQDIATFLEEAVRARQNMLVSGGTGSGKTTLLNVLSQFIPRGERLVTIEDSAELKLDHRNKVRLEARPANIEGRGRVAIRDLVINALRMRPDRIVVGECRGPEALDMLQAMNTGHDGSLTTVHANNPRDSLSRLENMVMMAGFELPSSAIREQIASAVNLIVQQNRLVDGSRKVVAISEVTGREGATILLQDIFVFEQKGFSPEGKVLGHMVATGNIPRFIEELKLKGDLRLNMNVFVPKA